MNKLILTLMLFSVGIFAQSKQDILNNLQRGGAIDIQDATPAATYDVLMWDGDEVRLVTITILGETFVDIVATGDLTVGGGVTTSRANISRTIWNKAGAVHSLTTGTDVAADDGSRHFTEIYIPYTTTVTGIFYLVGSVGGTDSVVAELFDINGDLVQKASSLAGLVEAGHIVGTAVEFQQVDFEDGPIIVSPGLYYTSVQFNGTTAKYRAPLTTGVPYGADIQSGTKWVPASIVPDSTWTVDEGIYGGVY